MRPQIEHEAVTKARNNGDIGVLLGCLAGISAVIISIGIFGFIGAIIAESQHDQDNGLVSFLFSIAGYIILAGVILTISLVSIRMMRQQFLGNALQVEYSNYAWLRDWANQVAADLQLPPVEIFITQDPVINAYALGFMRPYNIVLQSGTIRYLTHDEIKAVVVHEMAHVKYNHTLIGAYLSIIRAFPIIGSPAGWLLDFWGRRTELTADRLALCYLKDPELVKNALVKVHVGPDVAKSMNEVARQWQAHKASNWFNSFSQTFSDHPFLFRRLQQIDRHAYLVQPPQQVPPAAIMNTDATTY